MKTPSTSTSLILLAAIGGFAVAWLARLRSGDASWVAYPAPSVIAMWLTGAALGVVQASGLRPEGGPEARTTPRRMLFGAALVFHAAAVVLALTPPGPSLLVLVPAVLVTIAALARANDMHPGR